MCPHPAVRDEHTESLPRTRICCLVHRAESVSYTSGDCGREENGILFFPCLVGIVKVETFGYHVGSALWPPGIGPFKKHLTESLFHLVSIPLHSGPCSPFGSAACFTCYFYHTILTFNACTSFEEVVITQTSQATVTKEFYKTHSCFKEGTYEILKVLISCD